MTRINRNSTKAFSALVVAVTALASAPSAQATHFTGGEIIYRGGFTDGSSTLYPTIPNSPVDIELVALSLTSVDPIGEVVPLPSPGETFNVDSFFDVIVDLRLDGQAFTVDSFFDITYQVTRGSCTGCFQTEMVSMQLSGQIPGGPTIEIRESPNLPSPGEITITDLPGGTFQIDSFFDVFTELSVDGGPFAPAEAKRRIVMDPALPEPGSLVLLGLGGLALIGRHRGLAPRATDHSGHSKRDCL